MLKRERQHLSDERLLRFFDAELSGPDRDAARRHIDGCWACKSRLDDLAATVSAIVHARESLLDAIEIPNNLVWPGLARQFHEIERKKPSRVAARQFFVGAVAAGLLLAGLIFSLTRPALSAEQVLSRAASAGSRDLRSVPRALVHQRLRVRRGRTGDGQAFAGDYELWNGAGRTNFRMVSLEPDVAPRLERIYRANRLDWNAPLAAAPLARWRGNLASAADSVAAGETRVTVTTDAPAEGRIDSIRRAQLVVRREDWHPVELRLTLGDGEFDISELSYEVLDAATLDKPVLPSAAGEIPVVVPAIPTAPAIPAGPAAPADPLPSAPPFNPLATQMAILWSIHELGADLAEPVQVFCCFAGEVVVQAPGASDARREQLREIVDANPHTRLDLDGSISAPEQSRPELPLADFPAAAADGLEQALSNYFGSFEARENFTRDLLEQSDALVTRGYALRKLAEEWPADLETTLDPASRDRLSAMAADHAFAAAEAFRQITQLFGPLSRALEISSSPQAIPASSQWQDAIRPLFPRVREADRLIRFTFTRNDRPPASRAAIERLSTLLREIGPAIEDLRGRIPEKPR